MDLSRKRREARWFLHALGGSTLGPYDDQRVLEGLRNGDILPSDRIYSAQDGTWTILASHPYFRAHPDLVSERRSDKLSKLPSPRSLRVKAPVALPPIPVLPKQEEPEPILEVAPEPARMHDPVVVHVAPEPEPEPEPTPAPVVEVPPAPVPEEKGLLETLPVGPPAVVHVEPLVLAQPRPAPLLKTSEPPEEIFEEDDLESLSRMLEQALVASPKPEPAPAPAPEVDASIPARPEFKPVFLEEPRAEYTRAPEEKSPRVIQIQLKMPESSAAKAIAFAALIALAALIGYFANGNKTRDQKGFHLSDPSSPIAVPFEASDPNPPLKAPTRPQRDSSY